MIEPPTPISQRSAWSVEALVREVGVMLSTRFAICTVRGEISSFSRASSGHCYFNLKDSDGGAGMLRCAMFRRASSLLSFAPADGQLVELRARLSVYEPRGELQLVVEAMQRAGDGALFERFLQTKARLEALGLFDPSRKRQLRVYPRAVGVVTSRAAAALHDVLTAFVRRAPHVRVVLYPSPVQGPEAPAALAHAIDVASRRGEVDTLIVCRGGGPLEDLWAFNDERVVRAIVAATMPVICGVGHETDVTLADFAADIEGARGLPRSLRDDPQAGEGREAVEEILQRPAVGPAGGHAIDGQQLVAHAQALFLSVAAAVHLADIDIRADRVERPVVADPVPPRRREKARMGITDVEEHLRKRGIDHAFMNAQGFIV